MPAFVRQLRLPARSVRYGRRREQARGEWTTTVSSPQHRPTTSNLKMSHKSWSRARFPARFQPDFQGPIGVHISRPFQRNLVRHVVRDPCAGTGGLWEVSAKGAGLGGGCQLVCRGLFSCCISDPVCTTTWMGWRAGPRVCGLERAETGGPTPARRQSGGPAAAVDSPEPTAAGADLREPEQGAGAWARAETGAGRELDDGRMILGPSWVKLGAAWWRVW